MKRQFENVAIECWQHAGRRLGLNARCFCLRADPGAIETFLLAVDEIRTHGAPARRVLTLKPFERKKKCVSIRLILSPESDDLRQMSFTRTGEIATFKFTPLGLERFREAIVNWQNGAEDFSIQPDVERGQNRLPASRDLQSGEVWFWMEMEP